MKFKSDIEVQAGLRDGSDDIGTAGQILSSTGSLTNWIDQGTIISAASKLVVIACKNTSGATITKGTPVYQTGTVGATDVIEIAEADALISLGKQPAIGLLQTDLNNNDFGNVVITGELLNFTTDPIDGLTPTTGDKVFLKSGGGLTLTKPTGAGNGIQNLGLIGKVSGGNAGSITVSSIMRTNDVPNLTTGKIWVGDGNTIESSVVFLDEPNGRMGIGTTSPENKLHVQQSALYTGIQTTAGIRVKSDGGSAIGNYHGTIALSRGTGSVAISAVQEAADSDVMGMAFFTHPSATGGDAAVEQMRIDQNGNVGIGTTSPGQKLEVAGNVAVTGTNVTVANASNPYIYINDTNAGAGIFQQEGNTTRIGSDSNTQVVLVQNNATAVTIDTSKNVGINTTSPDFKLDVDGTFGVSDLPFNTDSVSALVADEITGVEEVTNGSFATDADWNKNSNWTISGGTANADGTSNNDMNQIPVNGNPVVGEVFRVSFEVTARTQGQVRIIYGGASTTFVAVVGKYEYIITATTTDRIRIQCNGSFIGSVDNLSIKQITSASNQIQKRELGTGAFGPTPVGAYLPLTAGSGSPLTGDLYQTMGAIGVAQTDQDYIAKIYELNSDGFMSLYTGQPTPLERIRISSYGDSFFVPANNGNVGIGTTSPTAAKLVVSSNTGPQLLIKSPSTGSSAAQILFEHNSGGTQNASITFDQSSQNTLTIATGYQSPSDLNRINISPAGNVGLTVRGGTGGSGLGQPLVGIGTTSPTEKLDVAGNIKIQSALLSNQNNTDVDTGTEAIASVVLATYTAAFFDFVIKKGTNVRSGTVYACHNGDTTPLVEFTETSTNDLGDTSDVTLSVDISGANMRLLATVTSDDWSVKSLIRAI